ncbi:MAG: SMI1/KNR4 family protein [Pseudomonadota bacterium]
MAFDLSEEQLRATEDEIGAKFPESYRQQMMRSNGGEVDAASDYWNLIPLRDTSDRKRLSRTANHVLVETKSLSRFPSWHEHALAIAENGTGDALVMLRDGDQIKPQVFYWCHESGAMELVAVNFSSLTIDR